MRWSFKNAKCLNLNTRKLIDNVKLNNAQGLSLFEI